jgi:hypothetical protein
MAIFDGVTRFLVATYRICCALLIIILVCGAQSSTASVPPPDIKYNKTTFYDGPGQICMSGFYIMLSDGEFGVMRNPVATISNLQLELTEGRIFILQSFSGRPFGKEYQKLSNGRLLLRNDEGRTIYSFDDFLPGTTEISGPMLNQGANDAKILRRLYFANQSIRDIACLSGKVVP